MNGLDDLVSDLKMMSEAEEAITGIRKGIWPRLIMMWKTDFELTAADMFAEIEEECRAKLGNVPTVIRTAKSVMLNALSEGIMLSAGDVPRGKSEVEKELAAKRKATILEDPQEEKPDKTDPDYDLKIVLRTMRKVKQEAHDAGYGQGSLMDKIEDILKYLTDDLGIL